MHDAAQTLIGTHDFKAFTVADPEVSSTVRTIESIAVVRDGHRLTLTVTANGFLRPMVRRIAGSLIEIGRGKLPAGPCSPRRAGPRPRKGVLVECGTSDKAPSPLDVTRSGHTQGVTTPCCVITPCIHHRGHREHRGEAEEAVFQKLQIAFSAAPQ